MLFVFFVLIDRLLSLCLLSFECLNTANAKDQCVASVEEAFFAQLWSPLLALFRYSSNNNNTLYLYSTFHAKQCSSKCLNYKSSVLPQLRLELEKINFSCILA